MSGAHIDTYAEEVRLLIETQLRIKGKTLERALARAGRLLPKWAQRDGRYLAQASQLMAHPKLRAMVDEAKLEKAYQDLISHLNSIDPTKRRKDQALSVLGSIGFGLLIIVGTVLVVLVWRGYL